MEKPYLRQNFTFQSAGVILKIRSMSPKSHQLFPFQRKFGQNPSTGSEDNAWKRSYLERTPAGSTPKPICSLPSVGVGGGGISNKAM